MLYSVCIAVHVLVAVLAVGLVGAIPITARLARQSGAGAEGILKRLLRTVQAGLGAMVITGILIDVAASGAFHGAVWFKASIGTLLVLGFSLGRTRGILRRGFAPGATPDTTLRQVEGWGWVMLASVGVITILMQTKLGP